WFLSLGPARHIELHSFPTRRSSDLQQDNRPNASGLRRGCTLVRPFDAPLDISQDDRLREVEEESVIRTRPDGERNCVRNLAEARSEEHTSELQSRENLVCRLLLEKK